MPAKEKTWNLHTGQVLFIALTQHSVGFNLKIYNNLKHPETSENVIQADYWRFTQILSDTTSAQSTPGLQHFVFVWRNPQGHKECTTHSKK